MMNKLQGVYKKSRPLQIQILFSLMLFVPMKSIFLFIISMTKLLDADWSRGVQLFH